MGIVDLPTEVFQAVINNVVSDLGFYGAIKLRTTSSNAQNVPLEILSLTISREIPRNDT
jgi:hypothetical protein